MTIEFNCPHCGKLLTTSDQRAGARAKCPACDELITVPAASPDPLPLSSPSGSAASRAFAPTAAWSAAALPESTTDGFLTPGVADARGAATTRPGVAPASQSGLSAPDWPAPDRCPNCRAVAAKGSQFCSTCGASLGEVVPQVQYAPFWRRVVAISLDGAIIVAVAEALRFVLAGWIVENVGLLVWFIYHSALESSPEQATAGKWLMGIIVCGVDGRRISFPRAAIRTLARLLSIAICGVGYLMPLLTVRRQALHDLLTDTIVVQKCARPERTN